MKISQKLVFLLAIMLLGVTLLSACSSNNGGKKNGDKPSSSPSETTGNKETKEDAVPREGLPLSKELQEVNIVTVVLDGKPASSEILYWKDIEAETNVRVKFQDVAQSQWNEKKGLLFASDELPDAFIGHAILSEIDLLNYGAQGQLIPLEKLIEEYAPNLNKVFVEYPELKQQLTAPDGHIYSIPTFDDGVVPEVGYPLFVNKQWLEDVGLEVPVTTDEFEQMLLAFKEQKKTVEGSAVIPLTTGPGNNFFSQLFGAFGVIDYYPTGSNQFGAHIYNKDNEVFYTAATEEYKNAIKYFHRLYSQGLIDNESFTQDGSVMGSKIKTVPRIVGAFQGWRSTAWANTEEEVGDYIAIGPLKGPDGHQMWMKNLTGLTTHGSFAITKKAEKPELLMRWVDNLLSDDNSLRMAFSYRFGDTIEKTTDNKIKILRNLDWNNPSESLTAPSSSSGFSFMTRSNANRFLDIPSHMVEKKGYDKLYEGYTVNRFPKFFVSQEESQKLATVGTDLNTYANSMYAKWIVKGGIDEEWDGYLKQLNAMGMDEYVGIYQTAFDRYNNVK
ncbi:extracellular solute-binding protein [Paenibacillus sp. IITD108]|uniref:extracellular solute-binding protein n=1 Tax=Paenibacillus sp. IITD108 TaxID=3116649 RepID=UPI002F426F86